MFKIITDSTADLPVSYLEENDIGCLHLSYILDGETYGPEKQMDYKEFFDAMRNGKMPTTSQVNPDQAKSYFEEVIKECDEILYIAFSSGLSGTYNSVQVAAAEVLEEHPDKKILVVDTLCASLGEGLVVMKAVNLRKEGKTMDEVAAWIEEHKQNIVHVFTVDDLFHLHRGGRVSKTSAILGTLISIKPKLYVDPEGHLTLLAKVRGRKKSLSALVDYMEEKLGSFRDKNDFYTISHGDCIEDAEYVRDLIKERFGIENCVINNIGPTVGSHSGPGTVALFFMGDER
ncbi:MAG: DegV family protein [Lachnospiraceae bacterium]|nr:DegV family protein [Lachnospiraceae bacterium]